MQVLYALGERARRGRDAISACLAGVPALADFAVRGTRVDGNRDVAYVSGTYTLTVEKSDGAVRVQWNFVQVLRKQQDGSWGIDVHMITHADALYPVR